MVWQRFLRHLGVGLLAMIVATSVVVVPPWALSRLWADVDRASQLGILGFYGMLTVAVIVYAGWASRNGPDKMGQSDRLF